MNAFNMPSIMIFKCYFLLPFICLALQQSSIQKKQFFATTVPGLEHVLYEEVRQLSDVTNIVKSSAGINYEGTIKTGLESLMWLRSALKVMEKLVEGTGLKTKDDLYSLCASVDWLNMISVSTTIKCDSIMGRDNPSTLTHSHFNALTIKNSIIDSFRNAQGKRPSVDIDDPGIALM